MVKESRPLVGWGVGSRRKRLQGNYRETLGAGFVHELHCGGGFIDVTTCSKLIKLCSKYVWVFLYVSYTSTVVKISKSIKRGERRMRCLQEGLL